MGEIYTIGDKFAIEIEDVIETGHYPPGRLFKIKGFNTLIFDEDGLDRLKKLSDPDNPDDPDDEDSGMEIGNLLFGHSRGEFKVDRALQDSDEWKFLLQTTESDGYGDTDYCDKRNLSGGYENETFAIRPYYWGEDEKLASLPNFLYKPSGFEIRWYKYPFRDSYMNMNLSNEAIREIFELCENSVLKEEEQNVDD